MFAPNSKLCVVNVSAVTEKDLRAEVSKNRTSFKLNYSEAAFNKTVMGRYLGKRSTKRNSESRIQNYAGIKLEFLR